MKSVINIRGANGTGKTTLAMSILKADAAGPRIDVLVRRTPSMKKDVVASVVRNRAGEEIAVLGRYDTNCGGCDGYTWKGSHDQIVEAVSVASGIYPHVVFEGVTITSSYGRYRDLAERIWNTSQIPTYWFMMDMSIMKLMQRVIQRTPRDRGPEDMARLKKNIASKIRTMELTVPKLHADPLVARKVLRPEWFTETEEAEQRLHFLLGLDSGL